MNLYQLASQDEAWGAYAPDDDTTPLSVGFADPPAPVPPGPVPIDAALDAAAREYGVDADVLRALGPGSSVDSIFDTAASLRSRLEAFGGDYAQALASYRQEEEGHGGNALAAPAAAPLSPPPRADARMPAPAPVPAPAPSGRPTAVAPRPRPARPQATAPVPGPPPSQSARQDLPAAPADGRLNAANDPRSLMYSQAPAAPRPFVEEVKSQLASGAKTLAQMLPGTGAAARWVANQPEPTTGKAPPASVGSVLEREAVPATDLPSRDLPLRPETRKAANNAWDAASPQDRQRLQSLPGWQGQLARERAAQFAQADKGIFAASPTAALFDTRAEGRTKTLIAKGEHPDFARRAAYEGAAAGVAPGQEVKALGGTVQPSTYDFATKDLFDPDRPANLLNNVVGRGVAKGGLGLGKGVVGISQFIEDLSGADDATKQRTADRATSWRGMEQAIGERGTHLQRNAEGAIASITQQLPMLVTGSFVPSQLLAMGSIAAQSFGQEYSDGKSRGLDPQQAAGRAGAFAAFEVIGEKFGLKGNLDAIRKATQGMPSDAVAGFLANQVKKEIPGEVLTTTGQFAVDKWAPAGMALNPNATFEDYFRQVGDTITQTVMQGGMMNGGRRVLGGMAAAAPPAPSAPRAQDQSTTPNPPHTQEATYESGTGSTTAPAPAPAPSPASTAPATGYDGVPVPGNATWSDVATATRKAQAEAEILRQAEALPAQESATSTATAPAPAAPPATPPAPMQASTDGNHSSTQQSADASPQVQVNHDADQADTSPQASGIPAPAPTPAAADAEADTGAADPAPTTTQHGTARHTAAAQVQVPAPINAQIQALDSGMLVVGGDQATILAHLHAGGVRGAEPFMGATIVPVDQAALAQRVLLEPPRTMAPPDRTAGQTQRSGNNDQTAAPMDDMSRGQRYASDTRGRQGHTRYTFIDDDRPNRSDLSVDRHGKGVTSPETDAPIGPRVGDARGLLRSGRTVDLGVGRGRRGSLSPERIAADASRQGSASFSLHEPTQPDDGYSAGTTYFAGAPAGGLHRGGPGQGDRAAPRATLVGLGIAERITLAGSQALVGERVDSPEHLAELAQVYRDPRYETFRVFFVRDGEVVHATGVSSRLPDRTPMVPSGMTEAQYLAQFREGMRRTGAQGYYILHNHPSGDPQPSPEDIELTEHLARLVPGMLAHVVINTNKYAVITPEDAARRAAPAAMVRLKHFGTDRLLQASKPLAALGQTIPSPDVLAIVGKSMQGPGWMTLVGVGSDGHVRAVAEAPSSILSRSPTYLAATVRRFVRMSGSVEVFAVGEAGDINNSPVRGAVEAGILRDAVTDLGQSLANGGRTVTRPKDRAQLREAQKHIPGPMQMQRDGTLMVKGDSVQLEERLRKGGVDSVLRREGGVLVGLDQVDKARQLLQQSPHAQASAGPSTTSQQLNRSASLVQDGNYAAPTSKAEDGSSPASRYSNRSTPPKAELSLERIDQVIQKTLAGLAGAPPVKAVGSPGDIGLVVPAQVVASGITLGSGDIYVFQSGVGSDLDVRLVVFHELLHRGVRFLVPRAQYVQTMLDLAARDTRVQQYANEWKRTGIVPQQREQLARLGYKGSELQGQLEAMAIEEGLARISEELNVDVSMGTRWKPSRIRALAQWLATVADKAGMAKLAQAIRAMTYNEAERFVMRAIDHAGAAGGDIENYGRARFSTRSPQNPWTQPIDSARLEMQRDGTLMVKGDSVQLEERLRAGGVDHVLRREGGVLVGLDQAGKARQLFSNPQSTQDRSGAALPTSAVAQREVATSQSDFVAENHSNGYSDNDGRVQEPTQPDDGRGPTTGRSRATSLDSVRGTGNAVPTGTASLVGSGFAGRIQPADDQGTSQGILRRSGGASLSRRTATLVGLGIAERIERAGSQALLGEQVNSPQRLAELAQVYRDPRFETFRVFFVKDGVVVHATGVSSRMPGTTPMAPAGVSEQEYVNQMRDIKQQTGADSYYLLHNHPSGNPTPSPEDVGLTRMLGAHVPGLLAHVVINSNKYAVIDTANQGREPADMVRYQDFGEDRLLKASKPMAVLGEKMAGPDDFAIVGKSMQRPGWITLIGTGADGKVRAISEAPASILTRSYPYLAATVRRFMRQSGSGSVFAVGDAGDIGSKPVRDALAAGILRDALPDAGRTLHQQGVRTGGTGFSLTRGRRVAEGEPGSSAPSAVSMHTQRDGTLMVKGDPVQLQERLRQGGVERVLRRKGGVLVGLDQVHKARQLLQKPPPRDSASAGPSPPSQPSLASLSGQQFSRSAPDQASRANNLPSKPATVQSVKAAVAKLTNSMGLLAEGRGRVVVATSADIQAHWEPLVGEVDMGSQDTGLAQGFFDTKTDTVFLIADHIEAGQEMAVAAHELV
ncbi:DNA repair protein, partial [Acidovorax sp. CF316]|uniref:JAB domain-containing protein n=1 Tax=Acidovorax sp. CF316 TaxID=1144317 RepID=UPI00026BC74B